VLGNAAKFFQLSDKERTAALLTEAQKIVPNDKQWSERLAIYTRSPFWASTV